MGDVSTEQPSDELEATLAMVRALRAQNADAAMDIILEARADVAGLHRMVITAAQVAGHAILEVARMRESDPAVVDAAVVGFLRQFGGPLGGSHG